MGKDFSIIDKNSTEIDLLVKWRDMYNIAQNLINPSDLGFLRFFRLRPTARSIPAKFLPAKRATAAASTLR